MNPADIIVVIIVAVLLGFAVWGSVRHFKGKGACCGGGADKGDSACCEHGKQKKD